MKSKEEFMSHIASLSPGRYSKDEIQTIQRAYEFAEHAHVGQFRANNEPYVIHVAHSALHVAEFGMDATTVIAALLHDTIEDTPVTENQLREEFGDDIVFLVNGVTKLGTLKYRGEERHVESLRKFLVASAKDVRVIVIKLADRLHNLETLHGLKDRPDKQKRIARESIEIYAPLADRLGMGKLKGQLEDLAFPYAYPKECAIAEELFKQKKKVTEKYTEKVYRSLHKEVVKFNIKIIKSDYRIKHKYSLYKKLVKRDMDIEKIYDLVALRVIVPTIEDCYKLLGMIHSMWRPLPGRIKDYIANPKPNGYRSLHTTIFTGDGGIAEIQIRTLEMHENAEYGIAAHFAYKEGMQVTPTTTWIKELSGTDENSRSEYFLKQLKKDYFSDRIFAFTPKGEVIDLPEESSAVDFAYAVHSHIGNHATGAVINGKHSPMKTKLQNGDIVQIITRNDANPSSKWLDFAQSTLARKHIQRYLREHSLMSRLFKR